MSIFAFVCCVLALAIGVVGGFVWGRIFSRRHPLSKKEMDALVDEAHRINAEKDFKEIRNTAIEIARLANSITAKTVDAADSVGISSAEPDPAHALPAEMQSFQTQPKSGDD